jgi:lactoylglutathione lyase
MINSAFPIISSADLPRLIRFYVDVVGGRPVYQFPPEGDPVYLALDLGTSHLGLAADSTLADSQPSARFSIWLYVDECDATVERIQAAADVPVTVVDEPADQPWGERVARILDPDGNLIAIGAAH